MKRIFLICSLLFFSYSPTVFGCANVNLQTKKNSPFKHIPIYDQDGLGACYAYTAAQLMDYHRYREGPKKHGLTNPLWLALKYSQETEDDSVEGGIAVDTINEAREEGICRDKRVKEILGEYKKSNNISDAEFVNFIQTLFEVWSKKENKTTNDVYADAREKCYAGKRNRITESMFREVFDIFKNKDGTFNKVIPTLFLDKIFSVCKGKELVTPDVPVARASCDNCTDTQMDSKISKLLKGNKPIAIRYCASVLSDGKYRGIASSRNDSLRWDNRSQRVLLEKDAPQVDENMSVDQSKKKLTTGCGRHASLIVGSRKRGGKCQYLLRNSWGSTSYKDHPFCVCQKEDGTTFDCKHDDKNHNKVGCWIDSKKLTPNIYELNHF